MYNSIGKSVPKYDGIGHVTGRTIYVSDVKMPGTLICKVLRCPYHKARIKSLDVSEARKMPGVYAVITREDVPYNYFAMVPDNHVLAEEITRYRGQPVAAVAATTRDAALDALAKIKVEYEELTPVFDPEEALQPDAPQVRPEGNVHMFDGTSPVRRVRRGDVEKGFAEADFIVEGRYTTPCQKHAPLECTSTLAYVDESGKLVLHSKSQGLYFVMGDLCNVFQLPMNKVKFVGNTIGGSFGVGNTPWVFTFKDGVRKDGKIVAREMHVIHDCGAFTELGLYATEKNANLVAGPNMIENLSIDSQMVYTNKMPSGSRRGFGVNVGQFAEQVQLDKVARACGKSPMEIRFINAFHEGDRSHVGNVLRAVSTIETLQGVADMAGIPLDDIYRNMSSKEVSK